MKTDRLKIIFLLCSLWLVLPCFCLAAKGKDFIVVIDPGHGGHDPGAIGRRGKEKNINLNVALKVGQLIQNNCNDVKVIYTRKTDVFIPLDRRAQIANNAKADLFISIHTNSVARSRTVRGAETYTLGLHRTEENLEVAKKENSVILIEDNYEQRYAGFNPNSSESYIIFEFVQDKNMEKSVKLATLIQKQFKNTAKRIDKGVHQAGFLVLRATSMPSVLVELGYISTPDEEQYLLSDAGTTALSNSIYKAFLNYKREHDAPIGRSSADRKKMAVVPTGRRAVTHWEVVARYPGVTHLRCRLETGRTHQLRVHMAYIGHPILGDTVYGAKKPVPGLTGQCLHATGLRFVHPRTGEPVELHCPLPPEFTAMLQKLQNKSQ